MQIDALITRYEQDGWLRTWMQQLHKAVGQRWQLRGLVGSLDAILVAATYKQTATSQLCVVHDPEEAAYFYSDLKNILGEDSVLVYPASRQTVHGVALADHPDQLMRIEVLQCLSSASISAPLVVTYPAALVEKVVHPAALAACGWTVHMGDELVTEEIAQWLIKNGFQKTDFVYEVGQFAIRGGIIDIFSYSHSWPFRIAFWGNTVESIRTFDPSSQRSLKTIRQATILPCLSTITTSLPRQSLLAYLPTSALVWVKDYSLVLDALEENDTEAPQEDNPHARGEILPNAKVLRETPASWNQALQRLTCIEFGTRFAAHADKTSTYQAASLPHFNQNFALLADHMRQNHADDITNVIAAESTAQLEQLQILLGQQKTVVFTPLSLGLRQGFVDTQVGIACYTDHQIFDRYYRHQFPKQYAKAAAITLKELRDLRVGDYVVHIDHGIGRFAGLSQTHTNGRRQEMIRLIYKNDDLVYVSLQSLHKISKYASHEGNVPNITKLGTTAWEQKKQKVKRRIKDIAKELIQLYAKRKRAPGFAFSPDGFAQAHLEASFIYEDTPDQATATVAIKQDMEAPHPMDRLVCGDVGFGKTEVAIRAAFKAVQDCKQVAVLVPTTILALQHYHSFRGRLSDHGIHIAYLNRFKTKQETQATRTAMATGHAQILIGTQQLLSKQVQFNDLGLLIIDEEQKFGVKAKDRLKELRCNVDVLTLTATPIPRTLHFSLMGARDLSIIATPPPNRQPIATTIHAFDDTIVKEAIEYELQRGGQVFFVHNRVSDIEEVARMLYKLIPKSRIGVAHGQMVGTQLERRMVQFMQGQYDVLVATSIIESGLDIPNVNTIFINNSHLFGLSDLHQMRGRVGRSNKKAFCYLLAPPTSSLTSEARRRLSALEEFSDLGDGFKVAMRDLDIRGAGNLLGSEQSGFIADVGFDTYSKILDDAVQELKTGEFKALFADELQKKASTPSSSDCILETDWEALIPEDYVSNVAERIDLYVRLDKLRDHEALLYFKEELEDRFGILPAPVQSLIDLVRVRWLAQTKGMTRIKLKNGVVHCYFSADIQARQEEVLARILAYAQINPQICHIRETKHHLLLSIDAVHRLEQVHSILEAL